MQREEAPREKEGINPCQMHACMHACMHAVIIIAFAAYIYFYSHEL